ncbi:MAG: YceI family protein [Gemmataceae bacterium]|nr:YceI family protein [Gemmataceae bacterium]
MKKVMSLVLVWLMLIVAGCTQSSESVPPPATTSPGALRLTPENTKIEFLGSKANGRHTGGFKQVSGTVELPKGDLSAGRIHVNIDVDSIYSDNAKLTRHLKSVDFFDVQTHPKVAFLSQKIEPSKSGDATHQLTGDLTLHGVTKPISFPAQITLTDAALTLNSQFSISRKEFAMNYQPDRVHDEVKITVSMQVPRK